MSFFGKYIRHNGIYAEYEDKTFRFDPFKLILSGNGNKIKIKSKNQINSVYEFETWGEVDGYCMQYLKMYGKRIK